MKPVSIYCAVVERILREASKIDQIDRNLQRNFSPGIQELREFLNAANPRFPRDTLDVMDAVYAVYRDRNFPTAEEIALLEKCWKDAWAWSGQLRWKYNPPILTLQYSPKKTGGYYTVTFSPKHHAWPLCFPLEVALDIYADMYEIENHSDECPLRLGDADDCNCESFVERSEWLVYDSEDEFTAEEFTLWLSDMLYPCPGRVGDEG